MSSTKQKRSKSKKPKPPNPVFNLLTTGPPPGFFPSKSDLLQLLGVVLVAVSVAFACNYIVVVLSQSSKPFCDSDDEFLGQSLEEFFSDICIPCPKHGKCFEGKLECHLGYQKYKQSCIEDGEINQTAKKVSEWVELRVCEAFVRSVCERSGTVWVPEDEIWKELDGAELANKFGFINDSAMYAKKKAMENVEGSLESQPNVHGLKELKCPNSLAQHYIPLSCYIREWVSKHILVLVPISLLLLGFTTSLGILLRKIRRSRYLSIRTDQLYNQVCDILEENAMSANSVNGEGDSWVVASRLRDHLLLPRERKDQALWNKVEELVLEDSRLDQYPKLVKGESKVVWEWQVEGSLSSLRKKRKEAESKMRSAEDNLNPPVFSQTLQSEPLN